MISDSDSSRRSRYSVRIRTCIGAGAAGVAECLLRQWPLQCVGRRTAGARSVASRSLAMAARSKVIAPFEEFRAARCRFSSRKLHQHQPTGVGGPKMFQLLAVPRYVSPVGTNVSGPWVSDSSGAACQDRENAAPTARRPGNRTDYALRRDARIRLPETCATTDSAWSTCIPEVLFDVAVVHVCAGFRPAARGDFDGTIHPGSTDRPEMRGAAHGYRWEHRPRGPRDPATCRLLHRIGFRRVPDHHARFRERLRPDRFSRSSRMWGAPERRWARPCQLGETEMVQERF